MASSMVRGSLFVALPDLAGDTDGPLDGSDLQHLIGQDGHAIGPELACDLELALGSLLKTSIVLSVLPNLSMTFISPLHVSNNLALIIAKA
jgi:hypothetical protein